MTLLVRGLRARTGSVPSPRCPCQNRRPSGRTAGATAAESGGDRGQRDRRLPSAVGGLAGGVLFEPDDDSPGGVRVEEREHDDVAGHGTAVAGIIRSLAPACEVWSLRVLGGILRGRAAVFATAVEWATRQRFDVVNLSLSTSNDAWFGRFHDLADAAYFAGSCWSRAVNTCRRPVPVAVRVGGLGGLRRAARLAAGL